MLAGALRWTGFNGRKQCWVSFLWAKNRDLRLSRPRLSQSEQMKTVAWSDETWFLLRQADGRLRMISWSQPRLWQGSMLMMMMMMMGTLSGECFAVHFWSFYKQSFVSSNCWVKYLTLSHGLVCLINWKMTWKLHKAAITTQWDTRGLTVCVELFGEFRWFILRWGQNLSGKLCIITRRNLLSLSQRTVWYSYGGSKEKDYVSVFMVGAITNPCTHKSRLH